MLSKREMEVLNLLARGNTCNEIGVLLHISENTVISHKNHCIQKLKAKNVCHLISLALVDGYLSEKQLSRRTDLCQ